MSTDTSTAPTREQRTITLTGRPPVTIAEADWPEIAVARWRDSGESDHQANRWGSLRVRRHADGRHLVYGVYETRWDGERDQRAGRLLTAGSDVVAAIRAVAVDLGGDADGGLAQDCIADLPPEQL